MNKPRVLVVDDDPDVLNLIEIYFENAGSTVTKMLKPKEALDLVTERLGSAEAFDLLIVDICMPKMDGNELTRSLRNVGYNGPIVAFTAAVSGDGMRTGSDAGITTYLSKSTLKKELVEAILTTHCSGS